jgi:hypothetical protein
MLHDIFFPRQHKLRRRHRVRDAEDVMSPGDEFDSVRQRGVAPPFRDNPPERLVQREAVGNGQDAVDEDTASEGLRVSIS